MSETKYVSDIQFVDHDVEKVYNYLSDFNNISAYVSDDILAQLAEKIPQVNITNFDADTDSCRFDVGAFGSAEIRIIERDPFKTIKIQGQGGIPGALTLWIQLLPAGEQKVKMRLTLLTEMGMMFRMMVGNKLEAGVNRLAETLARLPYQ
jgi:carbon monoxide dehydrogenase subunit G